MLRTLTPLFILTAALLAMPTSPVDAHPRHPYSMEVLVDGQPLDVHHARGNTYVEALEGREYTIRLKNLTPRRVAVALAVDGLNSIDAKSTSARKSSKWILAPHQTITIDGWQTGSSTARRFFFTTEDESYGAWLGKTSNLGVVSAAFFPEKARRVTIQRDRSSSGRRAPAKASPSPKSSGAAAGEMRESEGLSDDHAATGMGREVQNHVQRVEFESEPHPAAVVELRYEYRDALVSLGVLPRFVKPLDRRERARGFEDMQFAPVPGR